tara:strand:- start:3515 stop:4222 length:708 start_codon:yes stop_codon:yes gene_type:complete
MQTVLPKEVILVNDCSTDETIYELKKIEKDCVDFSVTVIDLRVNKGPAYARNTGWEAATSEYIAFLDSDDSWNKDKISAQYSWLLNNPDVDICGHKCIEYSADTIAHEASPVFKRITNMSLLVSNRFQTPSVILKRDIKHRFDVEKRYSEDYGLWLSILFSGGKGGYSNSVLAYLYKPAYGVSGLSSNLWAMQKGEVGNFHSLLRMQKINKLTFLAILTFSCLKFLRRYIKVKLF